MGIVYKIIHGIYYYGLDNLHKLYLENVYYEKVDF